MYCRSRWLELLFCDNETQVAISDFAPLDRNQLLTKLLSHRPHFTARQPVFLTAVDQDAHARQHRRRTG